NCPRLSELDISASAITNLAPIPALTNIAILRLDSLPGFSRPTMSQSNSLMFFSAQRNGITNAAFLAACRNLKDLYLADNALSDLSPLTNLQQLAHLSLSYNLATNISPLVALSNLVRLDIDNNYLDLSATSAAMTTIHALLQRGVVVNYTPQQALPSISPIPNQTIGENGASPVLNFSYSPLSASISASSSNPGLVANNSLGLQINIFPGRLIVYPTQQTTGTALITLTATTPKGFSVSSSFTVSVVPSPPVTLADPGLDWALRMRLGRPEGALTAYDLTSLTSLSLYGNGIQVLSGLEAASNLRSLDISFNPITNYSGLNSLTNLQSLIAEGDGLTNLQAMSTLTMLTNLDVSDNSISDCNGLDNLSLLSTLLINGNPLGSLGCLSTLTNLTQLYAENCALTNCQFATNLARLIVMDMDQNALQDISSLAALTNLVQLDLSLNHVSNISPLAGLRRLASLQIGFNSASLQHVEALGTLTNLTDLDLESDGITNLAFLPPLTQLGRLNLSYNKLSNIVQLTGFPLLTDLNLRGNQITDVSTLSSIASVVALDLGQNLLQSLTPLLGMTNLTRLDVSLNSLDLTAGSAAQQVLDALAIRNVVIISYQNKSAPTITPIIFQLIPPNATAPPMPFFISDSDSDPCTLAVSVKSSNQAVIPDSGLAVAGFCDSLALVVTPNLGQTGIVYVTIGVKDLLGVSNSMTFSIEVIADKPVVIPDPALQAMLRGILGKPVDPITLYDIRNLQYLYDANLGIASIDGLQPAINVGYADFSDNFIHDASPMANWSTLQTLILDNNPLGNIAFASTLPQLAVLSLRNTGIRDVSPLAVETNLTFLDVSYDAITNAGSLAG